MESTIKLPIYPFGKTTGTPPDAGEACVFCGFPLGENDLIFSSSPISGEGEKICTDKICGAYLDPNLLSPKKTVLVWLPKTKNEHFNLFLRSAFIKFHFGEKEERKEAGTLIKQTLELKSHIVRHWQTANPQIIAKACKQYKVTAYDHSAVENILIAIHPSFFSKKEMKKLLNEHYSGDGFLQLWKIAFDSYYLNYVATS